MIMVSTDLNEIQWLSVSMKTKCFILFYLLTFMYTGHIETQCIIYKRDVFQTNILQLQIYRCRFPWWFSHI